MKPSYMKNIWSPISENSNEDLDENWITDVLKAYEMVHNIHYTRIQSTDGVANPTHT